LPNGVAIERALIDGVPEDELREALSVLAAAGIPPVPNLAGLGGAQLQAAAVKYLRDHGGLHADYIEALAPHALPPLACQLLDEAIDSFVERRTGLCQL
jgi:hypothetical protein